MRGDDIILLLSVFGFLYWLLNGILAEFRPIAESGDVLTYANWMWAGAVILYLVFGVFWLPRAVKERPPGYGGR